METVEKLRSLINEMDDCNPRAAERKLNFIVEFIRKEFDKTLYGNASLEAAIDEINSIPHILKNKSNGIKEAEYSKIKARDFLRSVLEDIEK